MRIHKFNFVLAVAASVTAHMLLWPAGKRIAISGASEAGGGGHGRMTELTVRLSDETKDLKPQIDPAALKPKTPEVNSPDDMGEALGKGTGVQSAKGNAPMKAPEAEQDQAFLSRDPVGQGKVGDPPAFNTGPRGQGGEGGQRGGPQAAVNSSAQAAPRDSAPPREAPTPAMPKPPKIEAPSEKTAVADASKSDKPPVDSAHAVERTEIPPASVAQPPSQIHAPATDDRHVLPPPDVAPPPSPVAAIGAAPADVHKAPVNEVKATAPLAVAIASTTGLLPAAATEGAAATPEPANGLAPPAPRASAEHPSIQIAPPLQAAPAAVPLPPPPSPAAEKSSLKPKPADVVPSPPAPAPAPPAAPTPALVNTGDARAPGPDRASADPAQESDSESDPFSKTAVADVLHDGRLEVREGRKVKTTRPHLLLGAQVDLFSLPNPTVVLKIAIDAKGKVTSADVLRSSGSVEIDQPCRVAVYDWWFEPAHNKKGEPVADVVIFTIHFK